MRPAAKNGYRESPVVRSQQEASRRQDRSSEHDRRDSGNPSGSANGALEYVTPIACSAHE